MQTYVAARGSHLTDEQAQMFGERIAALQEQHNGVTPELVVYDAQLDRSPLHSWFEWNDAVAALAHRRDQASELLRWIHVPITVDGEETTTRAFHPVVIRVEGQPETEPEPRKVYVTMQRVAENADFRQQVIERALSQLRAWRHKYQQYQELAQIISAIDAIDMAPIVEAIAV